MSESVHEIRARIAAKKATMTPYEIVHWQMRASGRVNQAIRKGQLVREPCEVCGNPKSEGHHEDHDKPFEIRWLCRIHHRAISAYGDTVESMQAERAEAVRERVHA